MRFGIGVCLMVLGYVIAGAAITKAFGFWWTIPFVVIIGTGLGLIFDEMAN